MAPGSNLVETSPVIETLEALRLAMPPKPVTVACTWYSPG